MEGIRLALTVILRVGWAAGTLPIIVTSLPISGACSLHRALSTLSVRGKTMNSSSSTKLIVPQRYFLHYYLVALLLTTSLLMSTWLYAYRIMSSSSDTFSKYSPVAYDLAGGSHILSIYKDPQSTREHEYYVCQRIFLLLLMEIQAVRRLYETIYVFHYSSSAHMHVIMYLAGLCYYVAVPLSLCGYYLPEALSCTWEIIHESMVGGWGKIAAHDVNWFEFVKPLTTLGRLQWFGTIVFMWGSLHQLRCHAILGSLREKRGAEQYMIPHGDWFEYVSSPHYLAEIVIYAGILIASGWSDLTIWLLFFFVVSNLSFAASETQRWYHRKFCDYPPFRGAILPGFF